MNDLEKHLASHPEDADALVDLSNVVRASDLGTPGLRSLDRLRLVVDALAQRLGDRRATVYAVADRSLRGGALEFPDPTDVVRLGQWAGRGLIEELPDADRRLLDLAEMTGVPVVSRDGFADFRLSHPWIQGNTTQFLAPRPAPGRTVVLEQRDMGVRAAVDISRKMEESDFKEYGLLRGRHRRPLTDVLRRRWRCPVDDCRRHGTRATREQLPQMRGGTPVCRVHRSALLDDGPRPATVQLKLLVEGECVHRFTLTGGTVTGIGRAPGDGGIALQDLVPEQLVRRVSRRHLEIRVAETEISVQDVSSNGTRVWRPDAAGGPGVWRELQPGKAAVLQVRHVAELAPGVTLTRSGRRFPAEIRAGWPSSAGGDTTTAAD